MINILYIKLLAFIYDKLITGSYSILYLSDTHLIFNNSISKYLENIIVYLLMATF